MCGYVLMQMGELRSSQSVFIYLLSSDCSCTVSHASGSIVISLINLCCIMANEHIFFFFFGGLNANALFLRGYLSKTSFLLLCCEKRDVVESVNMTSRQRLNLVMCMSPLQHVCILVHACF